MANVAVLVRLEVERRAHQPPPRLEVVVGGDEPLVTAALQDDERLPGLFRRGARVDVGAVDDYGFLSRRLAAPCCWRARWYR
jgi:hypothetical protein